MKPSIKKGIIITSICAFTLVGIKFYLNSTNKIDVNSVSTLNTGYWDNPSTSTGLYLVVIRNPYYMMLLKQIHKYLYKKVNRSTQVILYCHMT